MDTHFVRIVDTHLFDLGILEILDTHFFVILFAQSIRSPLDMQEANYGIAQKRVR